MSARTLADLFREHAAGEGSGGATECSCSDWRAWLEFHYVPGTADSRDYYAEHLADVTDQWLRDVYGILLLEPR